jgi:hypothetical protein
MSTYGLLCPIRAVCLHTDCCDRVERMSTHGLLCPSRAICLHTDCSTRAQLSVCRHTALLGHNSPCVEIPLYPGKIVRVETYRSPRAQQSVCIHTALLGHNSPYVDIPLYSDLLCPSRAVCLHTDCYARVERYVYTRTVVTE